MRATGKSFTKDENFTLGNLLELELHNLLTRLLISSISRRNWSLKQLAKIEEVWGGLEVMYTPYMETETMLIVPEELVEHWTMVRSAPGPWRIKVCSWQPVVPGSCNAVAANSGQSILPSHNLAGGPKKWDGWNIFLSGPPMFVCSCLRIQAI